MIDFILIFNLSVFTIKKTIYRYCLTKRHNKIKRQSKSERVRNPVITSNVNERLLLLTCYLYPHRVARVGMYIQSLCIQGFDIRAFTSS